MELLLRAALLDWLRGDPVLASALNAMEEEAPIAASPPWLGLVASASADWSTKTAPGREVRVALELTTRGDDPTATADLVTAIEARIATMPRNHAGFTLAGVQFLRARSERRPRGIRAVLIEYRFRIIQTSTE